MSDKIVKIGNIEVSNCALWWHECFRKQRSCFEGM